MFGKLSYDLEVNVPASEAWEVFEGLKLVKLVEKELPNLFEKIELVEGDGGEGTVFKLIFRQGVAGFSYYSETITKIDNEKRVKETEMVEGGYLELGFSLYRVRLEVEEKGEEACILKSTIEYEVKEDASANASFVTTRRWLIFCRWPRPIFSTTKYKP